MDDKFPLTENLCRQCDGPVKSGYFCDKKCRDEYNGPRDVGGKHLTIQQMQSRLLGHANIVSHNADIDQDNVGVEQIFLH